MTTNTPTAKTQVPPQYPALYDTWDEFQNAFGGTTLPHYGSLNTIGSFISCGVTVLSGMSSVPPQQIVDKVLKERAPTDKKYTREAFVLFSDIDRSIACMTGGNALCRHIKENKLGDIVEMGPRMNPNTGNMIKVWIWSPPHESLAPSNKLMPIYGKVLIGGGTGPRYVDDPRFAANLNYPAREA